MVTKICSYCGGAGSVTDYSSKKMVSSNYYAYDQKLCLTCGGSGTITVPDPPTYKKPVSSAPRAKTKSTSRKASKPTTTSSGSGSGTKDFFTFVGLLIGAILGYQVGDGNWVAVLIGAGLLAVLARAMYKLIIAVIVLVILYFIFGGQ